MFEPIGSGEVTTSSLSMPHNFPPFRFRNMCLENNYVQDTTKGDLRPEIFFLHGLANKELIMKPITDSQKRQNDEVMIHFLQQLLKERELKIIELEERLRNTIADLEYQRQAEIQVMKEPCLDGTAHCSCVPILRSANKRLWKDVKTLRESLRTAKEKLAKYEYERTMLVNLLLSLIADGKDGQTKLPDGLLP